MNKNELNIKKTNQMKKYSFLWIILFSVCLWTCNNKDKFETQDPIEIVMIVPADGAAFNLDEGQSIAFEWKDVPGIDGYKLVISLSESFTLWTSLAAGQNPLTISARDFDRALALLNVASYATETVYWSILPLKSSQVAKTGKGNIVVTRRNVPQIVLPEQTNLTIDAREYVPYTFSWTPVPAVSEYTIKFALDFNKFESVGEFVSFDLPEGVNKFEFEDMESFDDMLRELGMVFNEDQTVWWTVEPTVPSEDALSQVRYFTGVRRQAEIYLTLPEEGDVIDMNEFSPQTFEWFNVAGIMEYRIKFSVEPDQFNNENKYVSFEPGYGATKLEFTSETGFAELLASLGICYGDSQTVYWSVEPFAWMDGVIEHVSHFTAQRKDVADELSINLTTPVDEKAFCANTATFPLTFSWTAVPVSPNYFLKFSNDDQFTDGADNTFTVFVRGSTNYNMTRPVFDEVVAAIGSGIWYWKVVPSTDPCGTVATEVNTLIVMNLAHYMVTGFDTQFDLTATNDPKYLFDGQWPVIYDGGETTTGWVGEVNYRNFSSGFHNGSMDGVLYPCFITFETGYPVKLAQYRHHYYYPFYYNCPLFWELWAFTGDGAPTAEDGWDNWVKIGEGNTDHLPASKDEENQQPRIDAYPLGETITFDKNTVPTAQYYRFKCVENWQWKNDQTITPRRANFSLSEILVWPFED